MWTPQPLKPVMTDTDTYNKTGIRCFGPEIAYHGGYCCGIKTIHTLGSPEDKCCPWQRNPDLPQIDDLDTGGERCDGNMFNEEASGRVGA